MPIWQNRAPDDHPDVKDVVCPLHLTLGSGVEYALVGRVIFIPNAEGVGHFRSQVRIGDQAYMYDDMLRDGTLGNIGPLYLLEEFDANTFCVLYVRTSIASVGLPV